jgi:acyl-CoA thioester hydrolase
MSAPDGGTLDGGVHRLPLRVYWEDTDAGGIVYHASYIRWMERGRTEFLRALGFDQRALRAAGTRFIVKSMKIDFRRPALFDDSLVIVTQCTNIGGASLGLRQAVMRGDEEMADADVLCVSIDDNDRPARLPRDMRRLVAVEPAGNTS